MSGCLAEVHGAILTIPGDGAAQRIIMLETPEWFSWLADDTQRAFRYRHARGLLTIRKERRARGMWYWSAYRRVAGRLRKHYLGRSAELTIARLEAAAHALADPSAPVAAEPAPPGPTPLLVATKLAPPPIDERTVARPRLLERLRSALGRMTLVQAPAGSGKTTLLAAWFADQARTGEGLPPGMAWVTLDAADNEPLRFWRYVFAALGHALPALHSAAPLFHNATDETIGPLAVTALTHYLEMRQERIILALDDYHAIQHPAIHAAMTQLLDHPPRMLHLVIAGRQEPPLPLARLRVRGLLHEIRAADLAFRIDEAEALLARTLTTPLNSEELACVTRETEGWAAGLRLEALVRHDGAYAGHPSAPRLTGEHQYLFDYLMEEVFQQQPASVQRFLLATAYAERICAPLCVTLLRVLSRSEGESEALSHEQARELLLQIERQGLFLSALDTERSWFRYHHLFAAFLRQALERRDQALAPALQRAAGEWFAEQGLVGEAVAALVAGGAYEQAADLVERHVERTLWELFDPLTIRSWLAMLPPDAIRRRWRLLIAAILTAQTSGPARMKAETEARIAELLQHVPAGALRDAWMRREPPPQDCSDTDDTFVLLGQLAFIQLNLDRLINGGQQYAVLAPFTEQWLSRQRSIFSPILMGAAAIAAFFQGDIAAAEQSYRRMYERALAIDNRAMASAAIVGLASTQAAAGQSTAARLTYEQGLHNARAHGQEQSTAAAMAHGHLGRIHYWRNDLAAARRHLLQSVTIPWQWWEPETYLPTALALSLTYAAEGAAQQALDPLDQFAQVAQLGHHDDIATIVAACRVRVCIRLGDVDAARLWLADTPVAAIRARYASAFLVLRELADLALARALMVTGRAAEAYDLLTELEALAVTQGRTRSLCEIRLLLALALEARGDQRAALQTLGMTLPALMAAQLVRLAVDEGAPIAALVAVAGERGLVAGHIARQALAAFPAHERPRPVGTAALESDMALMVEQLSEREREVLRLLAEGASTRDIAEKLVVAESTVKWHVRNICGKLQVRTRLQAVARARALQLL